MSQLQEYKCPNCGGAVAFDSTSQRLKCPFCDSEFDVETVQSYDEILKEEPKEEMTWAQTVGGEWESDETKDLCTYVCKSCGGEIIGDQNLGATSCPFCGNNVIVMEKFAGALKPDYVIPFKLDKAAAKRALKLHYQGKKLVPKAFMNDNHIEEVKGVYVPFWLFNAKANANMLYRATTVRTWEDHDFVHTETSHYKLARSGTLDFKQVPVDGSKDMPNSYMESIEPFDYSEITEFRTAYLAGYYADKYDLNHEECESIANNRILTSTRESFRNTISDRYDSVNCEHSSITLTDTKVDYALLPVWLLTTKWKNEKYTFIMNGQTGKFVGDLPMDKGSYNKYLGLITAGVGVALFAILTLFGV